MPGRIVRSKIAERIADLLGSREGREYLSQYGWAQGMPVVMATANELLSDVMGLVSVHGRAVLIAMANPETEELHFVHVSTPSPVLNEVAPSSADALVGSFFERVESESMETFRMAYWKYSAEANAIPKFSPRPGRGRVFIDTV